VEEFWAQEGSKLWLLLPYQSYSAQAPELPNQDLPSDQPEKCNLWLTSWVEAYQNLYLIGESSDMTGNSHNRWALMGILVYANLFSHDTATPSLQWKSRKVTSRQLQESIFCQREQVLTVTRILYRTIWNCWGKSVQTLSSWALFLLIVYWFPFPVTRPVLLLHSTDVGSPPIFMCYFSVHLSVFGISLSHFHPISLCFGTQQHQYSLIEKKHLVTWTLMRFGINCMSNRQCTSDTSDHNAESHSIPCD